MANEVRIRAYVQDQVSGPLNKITDRFDTLGKSKGFQSIAMGVGVGIGAQAWAQASGAIVGFIGDSINAASDLSESVSKTGVVFGQSADDMMAWSEDAAKSMGLSKQAALEASSTIGNLLLSMGKAPDEAAKMSRSLVGLAADLASFNNVDIEEVLVAMRSGLTGEIAPLRRFGVNLTEATLKAKAMEMGLSDGKKVLDVSAKSSAAYALILEQTTTAQGDFARTSEGMANQQRILNAQLDDTSAKLGQQLIPVVISGQKAVIGLFDAFDTLTDGVADTTAKQKDQVQSSIDLLQVLGGLFPVYGALADAEQHLLDTTEDTTDRSQDAIENMRGTFTTSFDKMADASEDFRKEFHSDSADVIRSATKVRDKLADIAQDTIDDYFDPLELAAELKDNHDETRAAAENARLAKSKKAHREARDAIVQALDDQATTLRELGSRGKVTGKQVDQFEEDAKASYKALGRTVPPEIQKIINKLRALAGFRSVGINVSVNSRKLTGTHAGGGGPQEFARGGVVQGPMGSPQEAIVHAGETVRTPEQERALRRRVTGGTSDAGSLTVIVNPPATWTPAAARDFADTAGPALYDYLYRRGAVSRA